MDKFKGILFAALSAATFGLIPLYANQAILDGVFNETILVYRYGIAGIVYAIYLLLRRMNMRLTRREVKEVSLAGVGGYGITAFFLMWSYHYMPTGCGDCDSLLLSRGRRIADGYLLQRTATLGGESGDRAGDMRGVPVVVDTRGGEMARIILCINVNGDLWVLYYRTEPSRVKADESGRADLLRVTIYRIVLLDLGRGTGKDGNHHETPVPAGHGAVGYIEYNRFCPVAGGSREIDRFCTEFRVRNIGADNGNRRGSTLFQ